MELPFKKLTWKGIKAEAWGATVTVVQTFQTGKRCRFVKSGFLEEASTLILFLSGTLLPISVSAVTQQSVSSSGCITFLLQMQPIIHDCRRVHAVHCQRVPLWLLSVRGNVDATSGRHTRLKHTEPDRLKHDAAEGARRHLCGVHPKISELLK